MSWLDKQVSLYSTHSDNWGRPASYRDIFFCPDFDDIAIICAIRKLNKMEPGYREKKTDLKSQLQAFTPAALLRCKAKGKVEEIHRTGMMQLDFDYNDIHEYDIEELKQCVFSLPFIGFCGKSCSGDGFYALAQIAEPYRLAEYAEHCFTVLETYGIKADESKGKKVENLRYVSYDSNMLIRENPETLRIARFKTRTAVKRDYQGNHKSYQYTGSDGLIKASLAKIKNAVEGCRWHTVQQVAFTLGGLNDQSLIYSIISEIQNNPAFHGQEAKYIKCAEDCFSDGSLKPL